MIEGGLGIDTPIPAIAAVVKISRFSFRYPLIDLKPNATAKPTKRKAGTRTGRNKAKLNNANFIANAKEEVVAKEKEKFEEVNTKLELLQQLIKDLQV
jgi:valyl-tRNA synthetase